MCIFPHTVSKVIAVYEPNWKPEAEALDYIMFDVVRHFNTVKLYTAVQHLPVKVFNYTSIIVVASNSLIDTYFQLFNDTTWYRHDQQSQLVVGYVDHYWNHQLLAFYGSSPYIRNTSYRGKPFSFLQLSEDEIIFDGLNNKDDLEVHINDIESEDKYASDKSEEF